jgi:6-pyruvoyltetrahydropterin/6-carboxytetrahydropterin synthase
MEGLRIGKNQTDLKTFEVSVPFMFYVKKTFHIAYAHRLLDYDGKCENLHGHNGLIEVALRARGLNSEKMVMDFTRLSAVVRTWLDDNLDHKVILSKKDPLLKALQKEGQACYTVPANPTAETLAELIFRTLARKGLPVAEVVFWETPTSAASYRK